MHHRDPAPATVVYLGRLAHQPWPGLLSVADQSVDAEQLRAGLDDYFVSTNPTAPTRCIDGRYDPRFDEDHLGPQVPGGAAGGALAHRLGVDTDDLTRGTFKHDAQEMIFDYLRFGFSPGGHRDDLGQAGKIGCGAIDGLKEILETMTDPRLVEDHKRVVRALLGRQFVRDDYLRVLGAALVLRSRADAYFEDRGAFLETLEELAPGSVAVLEGAHNEMALVVNFVPGTTFASNRFATDHDGRQAFGYDVWRCREMAESLLPLPSQRRDRERYLVARVMITVATVMSLTDGTLPLMLRFPAADFENQDETQ